MNDRILALTYILTEAGIDDLNAVYEAVKVRREELAKQVKYSIKKGTKVSFTSKGALYKGVVISVKVKKAVVECEVPGAAFETSLYDGKMQKITNTIAYNVPLSMLEVA